MAPSGFGLVGELSSGPTFRAKDAPNEVRVGAGCCVVSVGLGAVALRCWTCRAVAAALLLVCRISFGSKADTMRTRF